MVAVSLLIAAPVGLTRRLHARTTIADRRTN
jgi:hypothetical protein